MKVPLGGGSKRTPQTVVIIECKRDLPSQRSPAGPENGD
jgi:hypothetical protein